MVRTQICLTDQRAEVASQSGKRQGAAIPEAADGSIEQKSRRRREATLGEAAGIWRDRTDLPDVDALRRGWDRD